MTSIIKDDDKIFTMFLQYKELVLRNGDSVEQLNQIAGQLTLAHMFDHVVCLMNENSELTKLMNKTIPMEITDSKPLIVGE